MSPEELFNIGAEAMRSELAVRIMMVDPKLGMTLAPKILEMPLPKFQMPEVFVTGEKHE